MSRKRIEPGPGQESVWDYPRPPRLEDSDKHIEVFFNDILIADSSDVKRVLETSSPPVYYIPTIDIEMKYFLPGEGRSLCEWKGAASYYDIKVHDKIVRNGAWYYPNPTPSFEAIKNYVAIYPQSMDACFVDGEVARAQAGNFYGGWITDDIVGPFKGEPGTQGW
ncbi:MAG: DUF427 domain-containing protein [Thermodesulfobacteriota bacterium]